MFGKVFCPFELTKLAFLRTFDRFRAEIDVFRKLYRPGETGPGPVLNLEGLLGFPRLWDDVLWDDVHNNININAIS